MNDAEDLGGTGVESNQRGTDLFFARTTDGVPDNFVGRQSGERVIEI